MRVDKNSSIRNYKTFLINLLGIYPAPAKRAADTRNGEQAYNRRTVKNGSERDLSSELKKRGLHISMKTPSFRYLKTNLIYLLALITA